MEGDIEREIWESGMYFRMRRGDKDYMALDAFNFIISFSIKLTNSNFIAVGFIF